MMARVSDIVDDRKPAPQKFKWIPTNNRKLESLLGLKDDSIKIGRVKNNDNLSSEEIKLRMHQSAACHQIYKLLRHYCDNLFLLIIIKVIIYIFLLIEFMIMICYKKEKMKKFI